MTDVSHNFRTTIKRLGANPVNLPIIKNMNEGLNFLMFLIDHFYCYADRIVERKFEKLDGLMRIKQLVIKRQKIIQTRELEHREQKLQEEIGRLKSQLAAAMASKRDLEDQLRAKEQEIGELTDPQGIKEMHAMINKLDLELTDIIVSQGEKEKQTRQLMVFLHDMKRQEMQKKRNREEEAAAAQKISLPRKLRHRNSITPQSSSNRLIDIQYRDRIIVQVKKEFVHQMNLAMQEQPSASVANVSALQEKILNDVFAKVQKQGHDKLKQAAAQRKA